MTKTKTVERGFHTKSSIFIRKIRDKEISQKKKKFPITIPKVKPQNLEINILENLF